MFFFRLFTQTFLIYSIEFETLETLNVSYTRKYHAKIFVIDTYSNISTTQFHR
jgi:hypothetical protein